MPAPARTFPLCKPDALVIDYLDLLFAPWTPLQTPDAIPAAWVLDTVEPIWRAWASDAYGPELERLRNDVAGNPVRLLDIGAVQYPPGSDV